MELYFELLTQKEGSKVIVWLLQNYLEVIATITGFIYLYYSIKEQKQLWIYGLITSALYVYICLDAGIYADMGINLYYVVISIYGWVYWSRSRIGKKENLLITRTSITEAFIYVSFAGLAFILIAFILRSYTDSTIPFWDAITTSASIVATVMLARKKIEHWLIWIFVDAISVGLYIYKGLYPTSVLFLVYTVMAIVGYFEWKKKCLMQVQNM